MHAAACLEDSFWKKEEEERGNRNDEVDTFLFSFQLSCEVFGLADVIFVFFGFSVERIRENVTTAAT